MLFLLLQSTGCFHIFLFSCSKILHLVSLTWLVVTKLALLYVCFKFKMFPPINKFTNFTGNRILYQSINQSINQWCQTGWHYAVCVYVCVIGVLSRLHVISCVPFRFRSDQRRLRGCFFLMCVCVCVCVLFSCKDLIIYFYLCWLVFLSSSLRLPSSRFVFSLSISKKVVV